QLLAFPPTVYNATVGVTANGLLTTPSLNKMPIIPEQIRIRTIEEKDNAAIANVIRRTLEEFGANHPATVYFDSATDSLYQSFKNVPCSVYFIAEKDGEVVGGGGIFPSAGLPADTCELVKMYLLPKVRGLGLGRTLIQQCIDFAKEAGYKNIYLETMPELRQALKTYEKFGFAYLEAPMGNTGHSGCELWMAKPL
ncbi:MAG: GNAT family N-acetyltransferase, partial [Bacteroidota bacterium]|nr:GNAT family N-acetyltransferase [Bacteroidota bacterium]